MVKLDDCDGALCASGHVFFFLSFLLSFYLKLFLKEQEETGEENTIMQLFVEKVFYIDSEWRWHRFILSRSKFNTEGTEYTFDAFGYTIRLKCY